MGSRSCRVKPITAENMICSAISGQCRANPPDAHHNNSQGYHGENFAGLVGIIPHE
jgi:hypothetical protein